MADEAPRRGRGRPPLDWNDESVSINLRLPSKQLAALERAAAHRRMTSSELLRVAVRILTRPRDVDSGQ